MLKVNEEMKIVSILEYIRFLDINEQNNFSKLQQKAYEYMIENNKEMLSNMGEKFIDVYSCNYYNDYFIECWYLFRIDDAEFRYKKERVTLSDLLNMQKKTQIWLKPRLQGKMQDNLKTITIKINSQLRAKSILLNSCMEGASTLDEAYEEKFLKGMRDKVISDRLNFENYIHMTFLWNADLKLDTDILNNIREVYLDDNNENNSNINVKSLKEIRDNLAKEYKDLKKAEV